MKPKTNTNKIKTRLDLSRDDLVRLSLACSAAALYYEKFVRPRLRERDLEGLESLGYEPMAAAFIDAFEESNFDLGELARLAARLGEEREKLPKTSE